MKKINKNTLLYTIGIGIIFMFIISCKKENNNVAQKGKEDESGNNIDSTWVIHSTVEMLDKDQEFEFKIVNNELYLSFDGKIMKYNGASWEQIGSKVFPNGALSFTVDSKKNVYAAYVNLIDEMDYDIMKYNGSSWQSIGEDIPLMSYKGIDLSIGKNDTLYIAYNKVFYHEGVNRHRPRMAKLHDVFWKDINSDFFKSLETQKFNTRNLSSLYNAANGKQYIVYEDAYDRTVGYKSRAYFVVDIYKHYSSPQDYFIGQSEQTIVYATNCCDINGSMWAACYNNVDKLSVGKNYQNSGGLEKLWKFNGLGSIACGQNANPYVAYTDILRPNPLNVVQYNGSSWDTVGNPGLAAGTDVLLPKIAVDNNDVAYVAFNKLNSPEIVILKNKKK